MLILQPYGVLKSFFPKNLLLRDEMKSAHHYFEPVLLEAVPRIMLDLEHSLRNHYSAYRTS